MFSKGVNLLLVIKIQVCEFSWSKLKAFADNNFSVAQMVHFQIDCNENVVGKTEKTGHLHFLFFPRKASFQGLIKSQH